MLLSTQRAEHSGRKEYQEENTPIKLYKQYKTFSMASPGNILSQLLVDMHKIVWFMEEGEKAKILANCGEGEMCLLH